MTKTGREDRDRAELVGQITAKISVVAETSSTGATRLVVVDGARMVGSATLAHTVMSLQDQYTAEVAGELRDHGDLRLELLEPDGEVRHDPSALGYVLTDRGTVIFAAADFRPSPLHAVDSDRTVEALAEFLALKPGDTDDEYFANYTERQHLWAAGDGPTRLYELITELPGETEYKTQMAAECSGEIRLWHVRPLERDDLPPVDLLADSPSNARAQYPGYVAAWMETPAATSTWTATCSCPRCRGERGACSTRPTRPVPRGRPADTRPGRDHVDHWGIDAYVVTDLIPSCVALRVPATGTATVAVMSAAAIAHAGAHVEAHRRSRVTALSDSDVRIYPGAAVNRRPGSYVTLASESRMPQRGGAFRAGAMQERARGR